MAHVSQTAPQVTSPAWAGDFLGPEHLVPAGVKLDVAQFYAPDSVRVVVGAAGAAANATSVPVDALSGPIPSGTVLDFGAKKFARLTAAAVAGATSLTVSALATALVDDDAARFMGTKLKSVEGGTVIGRTYAERDTETAFGPAEAADDEIYLVAFAVPNLAENNDAVLYRHKSIVRENRLPEWTTLSANAGLLAKVRANYTTMKAGG